MRIFLHARQYSRPRRKVPMHTRSGILPRKMQICDWISRTIDFSSRSLRPFSVPLCFTCVPCSHLHPSSANRLFVKDDAGSRLWLRLRALVAYRRGFVRKRNVRRPVLTLHLHKIEDMFIRPRVNGLQIKIVIAKIHLNIRVRLKLCSRGHHPVCWISIVECRAIWTWHWGISDIYLQIKTILCKGDRYRLRCHVLK